MLGCVHGEVNKRMLRLVNKDYASTTLYNLVPLSLVCSIVGCAWTSSARVFYSNFLTQRAGVVYHHIFWIYNLSTISLPENYCESADSLRKC